MEMGHGDTIILADANYPAHAGAQRLVRTDGTEVPALLDAILQFLPLDTFVTHPIALMQPLPNTQTPPIWNEYRDIILKRDEAKAFSDFKLIERFEFYEHAKKAYAIVQTGTTAHYANISLMKGVL
jgi:L-fucose mutarotase